MLSREELEDGVPLEVMDPRGTHGVEEEADQLEEGGAVVLSLLGAQLEVVDGWGGKSEEIEEGGERSAEMQGDRPTVKRTHRAHSMSLEGVEGVIFAWARTDVTS